MTRKRLIKIAATVLVIAAAMLIVTWRRPLPLSATEERLVGTWGYNGNGPVRNRLTFSRNRTATQIRTQSGAVQQWNYTWHVQGGSLFVTRRQPLLLVSTSGISMPEPDEVECSFKVRSDTQVVIDQWVHTRQPMDIPQVFH